MRTGKDRLQLVARQVPITISGVIVAPGDWLRGDGDGVVSMPAARIDEILDMAEEIRAAEDRIRAAIDAGVPLHQARAEQGYFTLQSRR